MLKKNERNIRYVKKIWTGIESIMILLIVIACIRSFTVNYYKSAYKKTEAVNYENVKEDLVGYPAGNDIPVAKSIEDIKRYKYFTIKISYDNISSTRYFQIKEGYKTGIITHETSVGRHHSRYTTTIHEAFTYGQDLRGDINYKMRQLWFNLHEVSYGEYFIVTLESDEKVKVWMDPLLLDIKKKEYIKLPICTYSEGMKSEELDEIGEEQGVTEENKSLYINAIGKWQQKETKTVDSFERFVITFIIGIMILVILIYVRTKLWKKYYN